MKTEGRICPLDYSIDSESFKNFRAIENSTVYIVGGLYGNFEALKEIIYMAKEEYNKYNSEVFIIFNGDMHWFDIEKEYFKNIEDMSEGCEKLLGNVERELFRKNDIGIGCGCAYPEYVDDDIVERSNIIHKKLKNIVNKFPKYKNMLSKRKMNIVIQISNQKIAITHGDEQKLGGWECSRENLSRIDRQEELNKWFKENNIDILATTHTCSPAALKIENGIVINNGASGMPNFKNRIYGLITRISIYKSHKAIYGDKIKNLYAEALAVKYDKDKFLKWFDNLWTIGSEASLSYRDRIVNGPDDFIDTALIKGFKIL